MLRSPPIHWSSRSPRCTRCGPIFIGDLRSRTSLSCEHATRGYMAWTWLHSRTLSRRIAWFNFKRSVEAVVDGRSVSAAAQRRPIVLVFDFVAGAFTKRMATAAAVASGEQHELKGGHRRRGSSSIRTEHPCVLGSGCPQVRGSARMHVDEHPHVP